MTAITNTGATPALAAPARPGGVPRIAAPGRTILSPAKLDARVIEMLTDSSGTMADLARATGCGLAAVRESVRRLRWKGVIAFDRLALASAPEPAVAAVAAPAAIEQAAAAPGRHSSRIGGARKMAMADAASLPPPAPVTSAAEVRAAEAAAHAAAAARATARRAAERDEAPAMSISAALQAGMLDTPQDAMAVVRRRWPALWRGILDGAKGAGEMPGAYFARMLERGLGMDSVEAAR